MTIVTDAIAAGLALETRAADFPVAPFGYGIDVSCTNDIDPRMSEVDPFSPLALGEALVRRLDCPRGALPDDANYGLDLRGYCNRGTSTQDLRSLAGRARNELEKDDRVDSVTVIVTPSSTGDELDVTVAVVPLDPRIGDFLLVLSASDAGVLLKEIAAT